MTPPDIEQCFQGSCVNVLCTFLVSLNTPSPIAVLSASLVDIANGGRGVAANMTKVPEGGKVSLKELTVEVSSLAFQGVPWAAEGWSLRFQGVRYSLPPLTSPLSLLQTPLLQMKTRRRLPPVYKLQPEQ